LQIRKKYKKHTLLKTLHCATSYSYKCHSPALRIPSYTVTQDQSTVTCSISLHWQTNSKKQSLPSEIDSCSAGQVVASFLRNPKAHFSVHKSPSLEHVLSHINPVHNLTNSLSNINFNTTLPSMPRSPKWSLPFILPD